MDLPLYPRMVRLYLVDPSPFSLLGHFPVALTSLAISVPTLHQARAWFTGQPNQPEFSIPLAMVIVSEMSLTHAESVCICTKNRYVDVGE